jgi:2-methylisocitrate lyase-like PEP mutase family enzyme
MATDRGDELMDDRAERAARFLELHVKGRPLLLANAWDEGSARLLAGCGFDALATTSSGAAAARGRLDYGVEREETLAAAGAIAAATDLPVSADLEDCFAADARGVAETVRMAAEAGLAGCSIEDWDDRSARLYSPAEAADRVAAAAEQARSADARIVLTARAENHLRGVDDLADTIARLQAYQEAGADVLYAPAVVGAGDIGALVEAVDLPVNVLALPGVPAVAELAALGVARVSVGGAFAFAAYGAALRAARELIDDGTYGFADLAGEGSRAARAAFPRPEPR